MNICPIASVESIVPWRKPEGCYLGLKDLHLICWHKSGQIPMMEHDHIDKIIKNQEIPR